MGHGSNDKLYITHSEHTGEFGQVSAGSLGAQRKEQQFSKLPFDCCALTLKPFTSPVCTKEGTIYDLLSIIPFIRTHGTDPMTGEKLTSGDLIKLNFHKNSEGVYHDPVTFKIFNQHTHLVAIRTTGNVYAFETVQRLNIKVNSWYDLLDNEPFSKKDIITLQDPLNVEGKDLTKFDYVKRDLKIAPEEMEAGINATATGAGVSRVLKTLSDSKEQKEKEKEKTKPPSSTVKASKVSSSSIEPEGVSSASSKVTPYNVSVVSAGRAAASLTSTSAPIHTTAENALWDEEDLMFEAVQQKAQKGYARIVTNFGNLNLELYCHLAPRTCYNFLRLSSEGKYSSTQFHRLIPGFMLQGGDPTGTGRGGSSIWGKPFQDEHTLRNAAKHGERGVLSMANSGPNTNGSQFFLTFRATPHLDGKHTVFGRLVGGDDVLRKIELVPADVTDRPLKPVLIKDVAIFEDPFQEYKNRLSKRLAREAEERAGAGLKKAQKEEREKDRTTWFGTELKEQKSKSALDLTSSSNTIGVGKYLGGAKSNEKKREVQEEQMENGAFKKKKKVAGGFGDFSGW